MQGHIKQYSAIGHSSKCLAAASPYLSLTAVRSGFNRAKHLRHVCWVSQQVLQLERAVLADLPTDQLLLQLQKFGVLFAGHAIQRRI